MHERLTGPVSVPAALVVLLASGGAAAVPAAPCKAEVVVTSRSVADGIVLHEETCEKPLWHAYVVVVDLDAPGYRFLVTPWDEKMTRTSEFAADHDAILAVNGGFWGSSWGGLTVSEGVAWPCESADDEVSTVVGFGRRTKKGRIKARILPDEDVLTGTPKWMRQALFANAALVEKGEPVENDTLPKGMVANRHPRTAVGLSKKRDTLYIVVVDGRQDEWSEGMKLGHLARLLRSHGAWSAANLDGGSSSTLVVPALGGIVNRPSYKHAPERVVPNHLAIVPVKQKVESLAMRFLGPLATLVPERWDPRLSS